MLPLELLLCDVISVEEPFCDECFPPLIASKQEQQAPIVIDATFTPLFVVVVYSPCEGFATSYWLRRMRWLVVASYCYWITLPFCFWLLVIVSLSENIRTVPLMSLLLRDSRRQNRKKATPISDFRRFPFNHAPRPKRTNQANQPRESA